MEGNRLKRAIIFLDFTLTTGLPSLILRDAQSRRWSALSTCFGLNNAERVSLAFVDKGVIDLDLVFSTRGGPHVQTALVVFKHCVHYYRAQIDLVRSLPPGRRNCRWLSVAVLPTFALKSLNIIVIPLRLGPAMVSSRLTSSVPWSSAGRM